MPFPYILPVTLGDIDSSVDKLDHWPGGRMSKRRRGLAMSTIRYGPYVSVRPVPASAYAEVSEDISWIAGGRVKPLPMLASAEVVVPSGLRADCCVIVPYPGSSADAVSPMVEARAPVMGNWAFQPNVIPHSEFIQFGDGFTVDNNGVCVERASSGGAGDYFSGGIWCTPMAGPIHVSQAFMAMRAGSPDRGAGIVVGADSTAFNSGVLVIGHVWDSASATKIYTKSGGVWVPRAANGTNWGRDDAIACEVTMNSYGVYSYTVFKNGNPIGLQWTDTSRVIVPGRYVGFGFKHVFSLIDWYSQGIKNTWFGSDLQWSI